MTTILQASNKGFAVSADPDDCHVAVIRGPWYDEDKYERAERVDGHVFCCGFAWPLVEDIEAWVEDGTLGFWRAAEWGPGTAECFECGTIYVDTFDGCFALPRTCAVEDSK